MKSIRTALLVLVTATALSAQIPADLGDIVLLDGRTIKSARIVSQSPTHVTFRSASGISQVHKSKLPEELAAKYPLDEAAAAARKARDLEQTQRLVVQTRERDALALKKLTENTPNRAAAMAVKGRNEAKMPEQDASPNARVYATARSKAEEYFRSEYRPGADAIEVTEMYVVIDDLQVVSGRPGHWNIQGEAWVEYKTAKDPSPAAKSQRFTAVLVAIAGPSRFEMTLR